MLTLTFHGAIVATAELARFCGERWATVHAMHIRGARTGLTLEMPLLAGRVDAMLVPIGDNYTMCIEDAARAVEFVQPRTVIPMHYNTWDVIKADPEQFKRQVGGRARVVVLAPGDAHTLS
jgi:L-ascorbate metabolism protein UlaG (beta-lactamase superfamily)